MVAYKLKVMHDADDTQDLSLMIHNSKANTREEKNCGDNSIIFLKYYGRVCDTVIVE